MYNYLVPDLANLPSARKATFIFADLADLTKLSVDPNITMQISTFDEDLPVIAVVPSDKLVPMYEKALGPNTYILVMEGLKYGGESLHRRLNAAQQLFSSTIEDQKMLALVACVRYYYNFQCSDLDLDIAYYV